MSSETTTTTTITAITPSKINTATEHKENYKLISLPLMDSYNGLHPSSLSKLAHVVFNFIINNKLYRNPDNKNYSLEEDRRIYSNVLITPEIILKRIAPAKYNVSNKNMANDVSNLTSRIQALEDNNVFYVWRYRQPYTYLFVLERDVGCWKYYNESAFVTPKTLKKIVRSGKCIIDTMVRLEGKRGREIDQQDIERSFGSFLNRMIDKMNPSVASELSRWVDTANIQNYLTRLSSDLRGIDDFKGQVIAPNFLDHLPDPVKNEILNKKTKEKNKTMNASNAASLEMELIPQNENLTSVRRTRKSKVNTSESPDVNAKRFGTIDPFNNSWDFLKFYRSVIKSQNPEAKFYSSMSEAKDAEVTMDILTKNNKIGDLKFLKMWIFNFVAVSLRGNNIYKPEKTCLKEFLGTFTEFNGSYYG